MFLRNVNFMNFLHFSWLWWSKKAVFGQELTWLWLGTLVTVKALCLQQAVVLVSHLDGDLINIEFLNLRKIFKIFDFPMTLWLLLELDSLRTFLPESADSPSSQDNHGINLWSAWNLMFKRIYIGKLNQFY